MPKPKSKSRKLFRGDPKPLTPGGPGLVGPNSGKKNSKKIFSGSKKPGRPTNPKLPTAPKRRPRKRT